ncbi:MAG: Rne/Rng family ribonuclease [Peptococcaceae bacterium]|nr:Rne/Rng family ribonuclease [Peptococcaceae bacterium]
MKQIIISTEENNNVRAAVLEDGKLMELLDDTSRESRFAGSIFKGKVNNVVPGIQAAFVDIGLGKNAFLYVGDVIPPSFTEPEPSPIVPNIENYLKEGQEVIVQVIREQAGNKGPRVTTNLSLPGRYAVLFPGREGIVTVSRKIKDQQERQRLNELGWKYKPPKAGLIVRTLAEGVPEEKLQEDIRDLIAIQTEIDRKINSGFKKGLLYSASDPLSRLLREIIDDQVEKIVIDNGDLAEMLRSKLREIGSAAAGRVWTDLKGSLFERYEVLNQIKSSLLPKVPLTSGGYLIIEQTEALTVVDVNTGKYVGDRSLDETLLRLNMEAAREICRQIRLRNLSGIIIIDFIDMERENDWEQLLEKLQAFLAEDKAKCKIIGRTGLGLVEVTRKKEGQTLSARYAEICPHCSGKGLLAKGLNPSL